MKDIKSEVIYNKQITGKYYKLGLKTGWGEFEPGQFIMIRIPDGVVFLRRPFCISRAVEDDGIEIFYKRVGPGTKRLSEVESGQCLSILGPLGNGFSIPKNLKRAILVAGGYGIAVFVGLSERLKKAGVDVELYYGGRSLEDIQFVEEFKEMGIEPRISTEDGSLGHKGMITEILWQDIKCHSRESGNLDSSAIFCCGPSGLIEAVKKIAKENSIHAQISYETYMGCGMGVCLGCAVKTKNGYVRACKEGPVFDIEEVI